MSEARREEMETYVWKIAAATMIEKERTKELAKETSNEDQGNTGAY